MEEQELKALKKFLIKFGLEIEEGEIYCDGVRVRTQQQQQRAAHNT